MSHPNERGDPVVRRRIDLRALRAGVNADEVAAVIVVIVRVSLELPPDTTHHVDSALRMIAGVEVVVADVCAVTRPDINVATIFLARLLSPGRT